jgi:hypothetical protein
MLGPGDDASGGSDPDHGAMTSARIQAQGLTGAVGNVRPSQPWNDGRSRVFGSDGRQQRSGVRHLVIFRAPVVGCAQPVAGSLR